MTEPLLSDPRYRRLCAELPATGPVMVLFSGGVDSTLVLAAALDRLGPDRVLALTALSPTFPAYEAAEARQIAAALGARHCEVQTDELNDPRVAANDPERCYWCKRHRLQAAAALAAAEGFVAILDGSNADDDAADRPGMRALNEFSVQSPLRAAGLDKAAVRELSRQRGLPTADKAALACLATRIPTGTPLTAARLHKIELCETVLHRLGLQVYRARDHGEIVRIEVGAGDFSRFADPAVRTLLVEAGQAAGYRHVVLDLAGYVSGSMNRAD